MSSTSEEVLLALTELRQELSQIRSELQAHCESSQRRNQWSSDDIRAALEAAEAEILNQKTEFLKQRISEVYKFHEKIKTAKDSSNKHEALATAETQKRVEAETKYDMNARALQKAQEKILLLESQAASASRELREAKARIDMLTDLCGQQDSQRNAAVERVRQLEKDLASSRRSGEQVSMEKQQLISELEQKVVACQKLQRDLDNSISEIRKATTEADDFREKLKSLSHDYKQVTRSEHEARGRIQEQARELESIRSQYSHLHEKATAIIQDLESKLQENLIKRADYERRYLAAQAQVAAKDSEISLLRVKTRHPPVDAEVIKFELEKKKRLLAEEESKVAAMHHRIDELESTNRGLRSELHTARDLMELTIREKITLEEKLKDTARTRAAVYSPSHLGAMEGQLNKLKELYDKLSQSHEHLLAKYGRMEALFKAKARQTDFANRQALNSTHSDDVGALLLERSVLKKKHVEEVMALKRRLALAEEGIQDQLTSIDRMLQELQKTVGEFCKDASTKSFGDSAVLILKAIQDERQRIDYRCEIWDKVVAIDLDDPENSSHVMLQRQQRSAPIIQSVKSEEPTGR